MIRVLSTGGSLVGVFVLALLISTGGASGAHADDPSHGGDITVTVVDPTASASPSSSASPGSGSGSGSGSSGHGGSSAGGASSGGSTSGSSGSGSGTHGGSIPSWVVLSGFDNAAHSELDPLRGWLHSTVTVANRSTTETVNGTLSFRVRSFLGGQLGPTVTREITHLRPGETSETSVDLVGIGQWPLVQLSVSFQQSGAGDRSPIVREAWVLGFPWLLLVIGILVLAALAVARIRRGVTVGVLTPEVAV